VVLESNGYGAASRESESSTATRSMAPTLLPDVQCEKVIIMVLQLRFYRVIIVVSAQHGGRQQRGNYYCAPASCYIVREGQL
jgi:hypothetical protein